MRAADLALPSCSRRLGAFCAAAGSRTLTIWSKPRPDAFRSVLADARRWSTVVMRETAGGVFDTPERRAELGKNAVGSWTSRIRDEARATITTGMLGGELSFFVSPARRGQGRQDGGRQGERGKGNPYPRTIRHAWVAAA